MRILPATFLAASAVMAVCAAQAQGMLVAETQNAIEYSLDTMPPYAIKTAADVESLDAVGVWPGETVVQIAPDGTEETLVENASETGSVQVAFSVGGLWTLRNSRQGSASFTVRHSIFGTQGAGTAVSPAKIVDPDEISDLNSAGVVGDGYVFSLDGVPSLLAALSVPAGFRVEELDGGLWRIATISDGCVYSWAGSRAYSLHSEQPGPDRNIGRKEMLPVAFTGDNWTRAISAASELTLVSPSGASTTYRLTGTGTRKVELNESGDWLVTLAYGDHTLSSTITVRSSFMLIIN